MQREIATVIARELRDPRIPSIVTIAGINLAADMRNATVYVSFFDKTTGIDEAVNALNTAAPYIQRLVAARITMKHFPRLFFKHDNGLEHTEHIHQLLKEIHDDLG